METFHPPPLKRGGSSALTRTRFPGRGQATPDEDIISVEEEAREKTKGGRKRERKGREKRKRGGGRGRERRGRDEMLPR